MNNQYPDRRLKKRDGRPDAALASALADALEKHTLQLSNERIENAKATLLATQRGHRVLVDLRIFLTAPDGVSGLDSDGGAAVLALVREFVTNHRRGF